MTTRRGSATPWRRRSCRNHGQRERNDARSSRASTSRREGGATVEELLDAGLARRTERGQLVDAFRDRLVFPIYSGADLVGFVCRRNPTKPDGEFSGPKYLNTRGTAVFAKGEQLFGLTEATADLEAGSTPVLVEGPMDAIAVTVAT